MWRSFIVVVLACGGGGTLDAGLDADTDVADVGNDVSPDDVLVARVATWNLEQFPKSPDTVDAARALIEDQSLDLVGVQEVTDVASFVELADSLPNHDFILNFDPRAFLQHGILYRLGRVDIGNVERIFADDDFAFPRDPLVAEVTIRDDEGTVRFDFTLVVVHLKAGLGRDDVERREEANILLDDWVRRRASGDPDVIVLGDFNDELRDAPSESVFRPYLIDTDFYRFLTLEAEFADDFTFIPFRSMLDHVLVTTDALVEYGAGTTAPLPAEVLDPNYVATLSDHRPVVAEFRIP